MPRPAEPQRRADTLAAVTNHVLAHGLAGLSLRPLAAQLGTSPRMLLYDFGSKEALLAAVMAEARSRQVASLAAALTDLPNIRDGRRDEQALRAAWGWLTAHLDYAHLVFEAYLADARSPQTLASARAAVDEWIGYIVGAFEVDPSNATLVLAVLRGLTLDRITAADATRTDAAIDQFAGYLRGTD